MSDIETNRNEQKCDDMRLFLNKIYNSFASIFIYPFIHMKNIGIIDLEVIDEIITKTQTITREIDALKNKHDDKYLGKWMDAQDVCLTLNISPRTLQTYRDEGKIGYTQINRKIYYKSEDVDHFIRSSYNNKHKNNSDENNG